MRPGGTVSNGNSFLPVAKEARADAGICGRTRQRARSASSKIRDMAKRGLLAHSPVVNGCIGKAGNYIYEDKVKKFKFRVQSGPLLIIAQPAFRGVGATSSSISAPATPCRVGGYYRRTGRTPDPAAVSPARSPNVAGARNSVNNDTTQG